MGIGTSLFLIAVGAILKFAVTARSPASTSPTVGVILMIVGHPRPDHLAVHDDPVGPDRRRGGVVERARVRRTTRPVPRPVRLIADRAPQAAAAVVTVRARDRRPRPSRRRGPLDRRPALAGRIRADRRAASSSSRARAPPATSSSPSATGAQSAASAARALARPAGSARSACSRTRGAAASGAALPRPRVARLRERGARDRPALRDRHGPPALRAARLRARGHGDRVARDRRHGPRGRDAARPARGGPRGAARLDRAATGEDRATRPRRAHPARGPGRRARGRARGWAVTSPWGAGRAIARADETAGVALMAAAAGGPGSDTLIVPDANRAAADALRALGLRPDRRCARMRLGPASHGARRAVRPVQPVLGLNRT